MISKRRQEEAQRQGIDLEKEQKQEALVLKREQDRQERKERKRQELEESGTYQLVKTIKTVMDDWFLDPILGFIPGGIGDIISSLTVMPSLYLSIAKIRSIPLTLALIFNILCDICLGLIPFWIGNIVDVFYRSYRRNYRLIVGFVNDDKEIIKEVNRKALVTGILIVALIVAICLLISLAINLVSGMFDFIGGLFK